MKYQNHLLLALACLISCACSRPREGEAEAVKAAGDFIPANLPDHVTLKEIKRTDHISDDKLHLTIALTAIVAAKEPLYQIVGFDDEFGMGSDYWSDKEPAILKLKYAAGDTFEVSPINALGNNVDGKWLWQIDHPFLKTSWVPDSMGRTRAACPSYSVIKDSVEHKEFTKAKAEKASADYVAVRQTMLAAYDRIAAGMQGSGNIKFEKYSSSFKVKVLSVEGTREKRVMTLEVTDQSAASEPTTLLTITAEGINCFLKVAYTSGNKLETGWMVVSPEKEGNDLKLVFQRSGTRDRFPISLK